MRVKASFVVLSAVLALASVQCARIAGLGEGDAPAGGEGGRADNGAIVIEPPMLTFQPSPCGVVSTEQYITIKNGGTTTAHYTVKIPDGSTISFAGGLEGDVSPDHPVTLTATATPQLAGDNVTDFVVTAGNAVQMVHAVAGGTGPTMELDPPLLAFGQVRKDNGGSLSVNVTNHGTEPLVVMNMPAMNPAFTAATPLSVSVGETKPLTITLAKAAGDDGAPLSTTMQPSIEHLCGAQPVLMLSGQRITSDVTVGTGEWSSQACGTMPPPMDITVSNFSADQQGVQYVATLTAGAASAFTFVDNGKGSLGVGSGLSPATATVTVTPKQMPTTAPLPDITEMLHFVFTGAVKTERDATLHVRDHGSILVFEPSTIAFTSDGTAPLTVANTGTDAIDLSLYIQANGGSWSVDPSAIYPFELKLPGGASYPGSVSFSSKTPGNFSGTASAFIVGSGPACTPFGKVTLSGKH